MSTSHAMRSGSARLHRCSGAVSLAGRAVLAMCLLVLAIGVAAVSAHSSGLTNARTESRCIHDELQQRVLDGVARRSWAAGRVSRAGLPFVTHDAPVDVALATDSSPEVTRAAEYGDFRIAVSALDLTTPGYHCSAVGDRVNDHAGSVRQCTAADVLTEEKRDILVNYLIPQALQMHTDRLQVQSVQNSWKVSGMVDETCGDFKVPAEHLTVGLNDTDFVLYVTSVPSEEGVVAWATTCQVFSDDHPAVGVVNIPSVNLVSRYDQYMIHTVTHEIAHALGFSSTFFQAAGIYQTQSGIRNKTNYAPVINSTMVVEKTREHYGCSSATYMEVEDKGGAGSAGSHWKMRNARDELMGPATGAGYYSALTMAVFEDMGFYKANYSMAEPMAWGRNAGCELLDNKCMTDNITAWPEMFCNQTENTMRCTSGRLSMGSCYVLEYWSIPSYWQYFTEPTLAGSSSFMDYCPTVVPWTFGACNQDESQSEIYAQNFNVFSDAARCIDGDFTPKISQPELSEYTGLCANVACNTANQTYSINVYHSSGYMDCTPGAVIDLSSISDAFEDGGHITCPSYESVCTSNIQAAMDYESMNGDSSSSAPPTSTTTSTSTPTTSPAPIASSSSAAASSSGAAAGTTTTTAAPATNTTTTTATPRGNAAASLCSPRAVTVALLTLLLVALHA